MWAGFAVACAATAGSGRSGLGGFTSLNSVDTPFPNAPVREEAVHLPGHEDRQGITHLVNLFEANSEQFAHPRDSSRPMTDAHQQIIDQEVRDEDQEENDNNSQVSSVSQDGLARRMGQREDDASEIYMHVLDQTRHSARKKEESALFHLGIFLEIYFKGKKQAFIPPEELLFTGGNGSGMNSAFWDDMIGRFFSYLGEGAYKQGNAAKGRIAYSTASGYASSIKSYYTLKFRTFSEGIPAFRKDIWRKFRHHLLTCYEEEVRRSGQFLTGSHVASTEADRIGLAKACFWLNTPSLAEYLHLNNSMYQFSGRGSEVSLIKIEHISPHDIYEFTNKYTIFQAYLHRHKNLKEQYLSLYPDRDSCLQDWYFSMIYQYVMQDYQNSNSEYLFPIFADKALKTTANKNSSKVASLWSTYFGSLFKAFKNLSDMVNELLSSHHGKKGSQQKLAGINSVSGLAQIFRAGWEVRGFHTIFDYVVGSFAMSSEAGKALSNWTAKIGDTICGGQPPTLNSIPDQELLDNFVTRLFAQDVGPNNNPQWKPLSRRMLVASLFRHYDEFLSVIREHPLDTFKEPNDHLFVSRISCCLKACKISEETFLSWRKAVQRDFVNSNLPALPIESFPRDLFEDQSPLAKIMLDPRNFIDHFNGLVVSYQSLQSQQVEQARLLNLVVSQNVQMSNQIASLTECVKDFGIVSVGQRKVKQRSLQMTEEMQLDPAVENVELSHNQAPKFSVSSAGWKSSMDISDLIIYYFTFNPEAGYKIDLAERKPSGKCTLSNKMLRFKKQMKVIFHHMQDRKWPGFPPDDHAHVLQWTQNLNTLARDIHAHFLFILELGKGKRVFGSSLVKGPNFVALTNMGYGPSTFTTKSFPLETPQSVVDWCTLKIISKKCLSVTP